MTAAQLWTLIALGAFHGLHPGMGWMLAVARGLQEGGRAEVLRSLPMVALGHAGAVAIAAVAITVTGSLSASVLLPVVCGTAIALYGLWMLLGRRHYHWREIRLPLWQVGTWAFLMSSAHGAGLMLFPVMAGQLTHVHHDHGSHEAHNGDGGAGASAEVGSTTVPEGSWSLWDATVTGLFATGVHTSAMLGAAGVAALIAYDFFGVPALRWRGVTMDRIWALTLVAGGLFVLWSVLQP
ncbi:hypothetical protein [Nocardiopsis kunsanensis]|uniref:Cell wall anchor protein n=1 Tax=Nocardiopsis kunsanensis TaxID=141693 RepID=A0A918XL31_9ACTN|nr:hypothetical protein [Nocardiopsis kunsanensis]GHD36833.1 hypothetical protein GCM10007147_44450 [Nocardiopsis kunsanensis]